MAEKTDSVCLAVRPADSELASGPDDSAQHASCSQSPIHRPAVFLLQQSWSGPTVMARLEPHDATYGAGGNGDEMGIGYSSRQF